MLKKECKRNVQFYLRAARMCPFAANKDRYTTLAAAWMVMWAGATE